MKLTAFQNNYSDTTFFHLKQMALLSSGLAIAGLLSTSSVRPQAQLFTQDSYPASIPSAQQEYYKQQIGQQNWAIQQNAKDRMAYLNRANAYSALGHRDAAVQDYLTVMQLNSKNSKKAIATKPITSSNSVAVSASEPASLSKAH